MNEEAYQRRLHEKRMEGVRVYRAAYEAAFIQGLAIRACVYLAKLAAVVAVWWWIFNGMGQP